jgi:hypothetical protein
LVAVAWKTGVVLYLVYMSGLAAMYLTVVSQDIEHSITVSGETTVCIGGPAAIRVGAMAQRTGRFLIGAPLEIHLQQGARREHLFTGFTSRAGLADVNVQVPPDYHPGDAHWEITVPVGDGVEVVGRAGITLQSCPVRKLVRGAMRGPSDDEVTVVPVGSGPLRIEPVAEGGTLVDGMKSTLFLRVSQRESGAPVPVRVKVELVKGMVDGGFPAEVQTDPGGLGLMQFTPVGNQKWRFSVDHENERSVRELILSSEPTQHVISVASPVWRGVSHLRVSVRSLRRSGVIYGDLYGAGDRWSYGAVSGIGERGGGFSVPPSGIGAPGGDFALASVQVCADPFDPGQAGDVRYVVVAPSSATDREVLRELLHHASSQRAEAGALARSPWLLDASDVVLRRHIAYWLSLYPRDFRQPGVLMDTLPGQEDEMESRKDAARSAVTWLLGAGGGIGLLVLLSLVLGNLIGVRRAGRTVAAEFDLEMGGLYRARSVVDLVVLMATIAAFFISIVVLLRLL